ncbi:MAG: 50S ribosomal protein L22 [Dehalococcoidales bacterium]|nr:50S ribosomal protein L22 [Dehalococcoidales bacterium]
MEVRAVAKNVRVTPRKLRPLVNMVRGRKADEALTLLRFAPTPKARVLAKVIKSAVANAENNFQMSSYLRIVHIYVDEGKTAKRFYSRSRGQVSPILKRSSHITVVVAEEEEIGA